MNIKGTLFRALSARAGTAPSKAWNESALPPRAPCPEGDRNRNPEGIGLLDLIFEDYRTHDRKPLEPGFAAIAVHRLANARWNITNRVARFPVTVGCRLMFTFVNWIWGIDLPYSTEVGRRVRIWHHGGMVLGARAIGDDVHIRHNTTFGVLSRRDLAGMPVIGSRVDIGVGACVLGAVSVGDDSVIGANSVVIRDVPPGAVVMGVPARQACLLKAESTSATTAQSNRFG